MLRRREDKSALGEEEESKQEGRKRQRQRQAVGWDEWENMTQG